MLVGTSGYDYDHWESVFYPAGLEKRGRLGFYAARFPTVEINNTFYHLPSPRAFDHWRETAPPGFVFALKASRYITHMKKLKDPAAPLEAFMERAARLGGALGPVLFQLPPRWRLNRQRLALFIDALPSGVDFAFEFRDASWFDEEVYALLRSRGLSLCIYHMGEFASPVVATAPFVYMRLHGPRPAYSGRYGRRGLRPWADLAGDFLAEGRDVYVYFNNDAGGAAVLDAAELTAMMGERRKEV
ncbi:MAG TPA: DUF72 domain-containing protein [Deltaproteobacteria bacterium]|nr:DUF72 domain-containing protein [Deltaproteobacteria bacterium]